MSTPEEPTTTLPTWAPTPERVAAILRTRTRGEASRDKSVAGEQGMWTEGTRPTLSAVRELIAIACDDVLTIAGARGLCSTAVEASAASLAAYKVAQLIELSYHTETVADKDSAAALLERMIATQTKSFSDRVERECPLPLPEPGNPISAAGVPVGRFPRGPMIGRRTSW